jgi:iron complex outermembrane receptor protein
LVLLNGRRLAFNPAPSTSGGVVDTNLIPSAAIGRVGVLKDGAAALYVSDAITGVVNFKTRTDQRGLALAGDFRVIDGSDGDWSLSSSYGNQIGNQNVFLSGGYHHRSPLQTIKRDLTRVTFLENPHGGYTPIGNPGTYVALGANFSAIGAPRRDVNCASLNGVPSFTGTTAACYSQTSPPVLSNSA